MAELRAVCETIGLRGARTCLQSGNIVFTASAKALPTVGEQVAKAIESRWGFRPGVTTRTARELLAVVASSPFKDRTDLDPARLMVMFLDAAPAEGAGRVQGLARGSEELALRGRELFVYFPEGVSKSRLSFAAIERALGVSGTTRNWNTVTRVLSMASPERPNSGRLEVPRAGGGERHRRDHHGREP